MSFSGFDRLPINLHNLHFSFKDTQKITGVMKQVLPASIKTKIQVDDAIRTKHGSHAASRDGTHLISVGGGPRATMQVAAEMALMKQREADFAKIAELGGKYDIRTTIVERKGAAWLGRGNAWGDEQGGTVNSGAEGGTLGFQGRLTTFIKHNYNKFLRAYSSNPVIAANFASACDGTEAPVGEPAVERGMLMRRDQGREELQHFLDTCEETLPKFPFYKLTVLTDTEVSHIDISDPARPNVTLKSAKSKGGIERQLRADIVRLNTGTPLESPIKDPAVKKHSFIQAMNQEAMTKFLRNKKLLDRHGKLDPTKKLAIGGTQLSVYDQLLALMPTMDLIEPDPTSPVGYRITELAKKKYQGSITFISNTNGKWVPPRHAHGPAWTQQTDPLGTPEEQHAAFLHENGQEIFMSWHNIVQASVALATGKTIKEVEQTGLNTKEVLQAQYESTEQYAAVLKQAKGLPEKERQAKLAQAAQTIDGAKRQGFLSSILGFGMTRAPGKTAEKMKAMAPLTYPEEGYVMHRMQVNAISQPGTETAANNAALLKNFNTAMAHVTASPFHIHALAPMLMEAGIATHMQGSYSGLQENAEKNGLTFTAKNKETAKFDAFIVSPIFNRRAEAVHTSLAGQTKPIDPALPDIPEVTAHRRIMDKNGVASHLEDYGLNGKGETVPGTQSKLGIFSVDVNNRESGESTAPGAALRRMAAAHLAAAGSRDAVSEVDQLYMKFLPTEEEFRQQAMKFEPHFNELMARNEYLHASDEAAGDDAAFFGTLAEKGRNAAGRKSALNMARKIREKNLHDPSDPEIQQQIEHFTEGMQRYEEGLQTLPKFSPVSRDDFQKRYVDVPLSIHEAVYEEAVKLAEERLLKRQIANKNGPKIKATYNNKASLERSRRTYNPSPEKSQIWFDHISEKGSFESLDKPPVLPPIVSVM